MDEYSSDQVPMKRLGRLRRQNDDLEEAVDTFEKVSEQISDSIKLTDDDEINIFSSEEKKNANKKKKHDKPRIKKNDFVMRDKKYEDGEIEEEGKPKRQRRTKTQEHNGDEDEIKESKKLNKKQKKPTSNLVANDALLEKYQNDPRFQTEEPEQQHISSDGEQDWQDRGGQKVDQPGMRQSRAPKPAITNRHKFFKHFNEEDLEVVHQVEEEIINEELVFKKQGEQLLEKEKATKLFEKAQQYKQKVCVFEQPQEDSLIAPPQTTKQPSSSTDLLFRRGTSLQSIDYNDNVELQLIMPKVGAKNSLIDGTLYVNKYLQQQGLQRIKTNSTALQSTIQTKSMSRSDFYQNVHKQKQNEGRKNNIELDDLMKKFKKTDYHEIQKTKDEKKAKIEGEVKEKAEEETSDEEVKSEDLRKEAGEQSDSIVPDSCEDEAKEDKPQKQDILEEPLQNNVDQAQKQLAQELLVEKQLPAVDNNKIQEEIQDEIILSNPEIEIDEEEQMELEEIKKPIIKLKIDSEDEDEQFVEEEIQLFSKLRKLSQVQAKKRQQRKEEEERKAQRQQERQKMKEYISRNFVEDEAELGSDNEDHDDIVKNKAGDDSENENDDYQDLVGMIDDQLGDVNEENEERAYKMFLRTLQDKDKEDIRKILRGEFKGRKKAREINIDILDNHNAETARLARMEERIQSLQDPTHAHDYDDDDDDDGIPNNHGILNKEELRQEMLTEKQCANHIKLRNQVAQLKGNKPPELSFLNQNILKKISQISKVETKVQPQQQKRLSFGAMRNSNSFLNRSQFSMFGDRNNQNVLVSKEPNNNSNSISLLNKQEKNPNKNYALNRLFANSQVNTNVNQQITKTPNKIHIFGQKRK